MLEKAVTERPDGALEGKDAEDVKLGRELGEIENLPDRLGEGAELSDLPDEIHDSEDKPLVREGDQYDENRELKPNIRYRTDDGKGREYIYETDDQGRIISTKTDRLELKDRERLKNESNTPDKKETDQAGHIIADNFGGSPELDNLLSQDARLNQGDWKNMETEWADALKEGKHVSVDIEVKYDGESKRPSSYEVTYSIDGEVYTKEFRNGES